MRKERGEIKGEFLLILLIIAVIGFVAWFIITKKPLPFQKMKVVPNQVNVITENIQNEESNNTDLSEEDSNENNNDNNSNFLVASAIGGRKAYTDPSAKYRVLARERYFTLELTQKGKVYIHMTTDQRDTLEEYGIIPNDNWVGFELNELTEIKGLSGKVVDFKFGRFGDSTKDSALIFLLEDGTVEYTEFFNLIGNCTSEGKINDLKDIVKIQSVLRVYDDEERDSIVAIDSQNNIYDIGELLGL